MGRGCALEILLGADDFPADLAAVYGYVNRVRPESELEQFVDAFARRVAGLDKVAVRETKALVDAVTQPPAEEFGTALAAFFRISGRPENAHLVKRLIDGGLQRPGGVEHDLGRQVAASS